MFEYVPNPDAAHPQLLSLPRSVPVLCEASSTLHQLVSPLSHPARLTVWPIGCRVIMENQMEKKMNNEMEPGFIWGVIGDIV